MSRPTTPPPVERFPDAGRPFGTRAVGLRFDTVRILLRGLDDPVADALLRRFGPFVSAIGDDERAIRIEVGGEDLDYFLSPPPAPERNPVLVAAEVGRVRYLGYRVGGWFEPEDGRGVLRLTRGDYEPAERAVENYVRCAVAWRAILAGGALVHAASSVLDGRGFLFFGHSGAGKSTLAELDRRGRVVSDDLSLVLPGADGRLRLVGSPFRGTYEGGDPVVGSFPLAAGFRIVQAPHARVVAAPREIVFAGLVANLPFVVDSVDRLPGLLDGLLAAFADVPLRQLEFRRDDSYWDAIAEAGLLAGTS